MRQQLTIGPIPTIASAGSAATNVGHARFSVTNAARDLNTCITAGIPYITAASGSYLYPDAVYLVLEYGTASQARVVWQDSTSAPACGATPLGNLIPVEPAAPMYITPAEKVTTGQIRIIGSVAGPAYGQATFEWFDRK